MRSKNIFFLLFVLVSFSFFSQQLNTSPFSRYGIGEINTIQSAHYLGWSNSSVAFADSRYINISNPASYSQFVKHNPLFDVSLTGKNSIYESNYNNEFKTSSGNNFGLNNMFLGLPLTKRWGMVIGIIPMSSIGYELTSESIIDTSIVTSKFTGDGSINKLLIGNGFNIVNKGDSTRFSFGFNASYLFGTLNYMSSFIHSSPGSYNSRIHKRSTLSGWNFDGGLQFFKSFKNSNKNRYFLRIGSCLSLGSDLSSNNDDYAYTFLYNYGVQEIAIDTIENIENQPGKLSIPTKMSFGIGFGKNKNSQRSWDFSIQYSISDWSNFSHISNGNNESALPLGPSSTIAVGYRIIPNLDWSNNNKSIFSKSSYSFGYHHTKSAILIENIGLVNNGINFGVSIPLLSSRSLSMMNLSCEVGRLGDIGINKIEENYIKFAIGFTMAPDTRYDRWFRKRKYD